MIEQYFALTHMDYTLSEPIPLPEDQVGKEQFLLKYAPKIARSYGENFDPNNPDEQLAASKEASHIVLAHDTQGEPVGLLAYRALSPDDPKSSEFYDNLDINKLPAHLYPSFLPEENRERISRFIRERINSWFGLEFLDKVVAPQLGSNGLGNKLAEAAAAKLKDENLFILGNAQPPASVLSRQKIFDNDKPRPKATIWGGETLRPELLLPGGLTPAELQVLALVFSHSFAKKHYPESLNIAAGENFDMNGLLHTSAWPKHLEATNFSYAKNNLAVPQAYKAEQKILQRQQETGKPYSGIATTILDKPN